MLRELAGAIPGPSFIAIQVFKFITGQKIRIAVRSSKNKEMNEI